VESAFSRMPYDGSMQDPGYELLRILLLRASVNKGMKKGRGHKRPRLSLSVVARACRHLADSQAWLELLHDAADSG
jgi:hypothetical protein